MTTITKLTDLEIYSDALNLAKEVYFLIRNPKLEKEYSLKDQIKRASLSIPANIAEGYGRKSGKDFSYFVSVALGSVNELITYLNFLEIVFSIDANAIILKYDILSRRIYTFRTKLK